MDIFADTPPDDAPSCEPDDDPKLAFEERRALAALTTRLTGKPKEIEVGRYRVLEPLGEGGFATVYEGHDPKLDRRVAIKILRGAHSKADRTAHERMAREAQALAQLRHPNVVQIFDVGFHEHEDAGRSVYIVMELLEGGTLEAWQKQERRDTEAILTAYRQAARGLAAAHAVGVVHRDFKPSNAMFTVSGRVKVLDFGLATVDGMVSQNTAPASETVSAVEPVSLTRTGVVMGTPRYMSPEQHRARPITEQSDQFAWCIALWEAMTGKAPFHGSSIAELEIEKRDGPPPRPTTIPRRVYSALARGLAPEPERRFRSMAALVAALEPSRMRYVAAGGVLAAAAGLAAVASTAETPLPLCTTDATRWDARFEEVVTRVTPPRGSPRWGVQEKVRLRLHRFEGQWAATRSEVCTAPGQPDPEAVARAACLQRGRTHFDAVLTGVVDEAGAPEARAIRQLLAFPVPQRCLSGEAPRLYQTDEAREARLDALDTIAQRWMTSREPVDESTIARVTAEADELDDHWLSARVAMGRSMLHFTTGDSAAAAEEIRAAVYTAETGSDPLLAAELIPGVMAHRIDAGAPPEEIEPLLQRNRTLLEAAGQPLGPTLRYLAVAAIAETRKGDFDRAVALATEAVEAAGDPPLPGTENLLAMALVTVYSVQSGVLPPEEVEAGARRALAMGTDEDRWYGTVAAIARHTLGDLALEAGDLDRAATEQFAAATHLAKMSPGPTASLMYMLATYGRTLAFRGAGELGIAHMRNGYDWILDNVGPLDLKLDIIASQLVAANLERGRPDRALVWAERQQGHATRQYGEGHPETALPYASAARALVQLSRLEDADKALATAVSLAAGKEQYVFNTWQPAAELRLAQGRLAEARVQIELAIDDLDPEYHAPMEEGVRGEFFETYAKILEGLGETEPAQEAMRAAITAMQSASYWHQERATALLAAQTEPAPE
ncbi:MAG: serine/threonine-protein kinase [Myxococcota bacterium]